MATVIKYYYFCFRKIISLPLGITGRQIGVSAPPNHEGGQVQRFEEFATLGGRAHVIGRTIETEDRLSRSTAKWSYVRLIMSDGRPRGLPILERVS